jgi:glycosyltransferase involved in cell wall biosynthesis
MSVSIAMATFNGERFLEAQLASIGGQTQLPAELVISDDGSSDRTLDIVHAFAKTAPFEVRILKKDKRLGYSDNFLFAAKNTRHPLIAFCDQDDVWLPEKLETGLRRIEADGSLLALHTLTETDGALNPIGQVTQDIKGDAVTEPLTVLPYKFGWGNTMLFSRTLLEVINPAKRPRQQEETGPLSHDRWIYALADGLGRVSNIAAPLILYRQHGTNVVGLEKRDFRRYLTHRWIKAVPHARERLIYYRAMSAVFTQIAGRSVLFQAQALAAAQKYASMSIPLRDRLETYDGPSFAGRFAAYRRFQQAQNFGPLSGFKHVFLGVSGLHKFVETSLNNAPAPETISQGDGSSGSTVGSAGARDSVTP